MRLKKEFPKLAKVPWQNYARRMHKLYPEVAAKFDVVKPDLQQSSWQRAISLRRP